MSRFAEVLFMLGSIFCLATYASAECHYEVVSVSPMKTSRSYNLAELSDFVVAEIRPLLAQTNQRAQVVITQTCDDRVIDVSLQMRMDDYSLVRFENTEVHEKFYLYDEQNIEISKEKFDHYFSAAKNFAQNSKTRQIEILKFFAYLFVDAARFETIEQRLDDLFQHNCRVNWAESKRLLRRWGRLSAFAAAAKISGHQYAGGKNNNLYAPISEKVIKAYSREALDGDNTSFDQYLDPRDFGWVVSFGTSACSVDQMTLQEERDEILTLLAFNIVLKDWQTADKKPRRGHNIGAVLADQNGMPIFWSRNANLALDDASQHGEVRLIQNYLACEGVGDYASGLTVYSTLEPCAMCSGMMTLTQVDRVVYGQSDPGYGGVATVLRAIDYPNVYEDSPLLYGRLKKSFDAAYKSFCESQQGGIVGFLLSEQAKSLFEEAKVWLTGYQTRYPENKAVLNAAIEMAQNAKIEDPVKGLRANCPIN